ncbi:MAG: hypothetical protein GWP08_21020 [Nitrospiraceae bacterium]|nr:hypothetical protein [Nitrospiraceae bacterium]
MRLSRVFLYVMCAGSVLVSAGVACAASTVYPLEVLPPEHKQVVDPETGAELLFLTTNEASDTNLYFHERSWLADGSMILFVSSRENGGLMGYLVETGELVRLTTPAGGLGRATAALRGKRVFAMRGAEVVELTLEFGVSADPLKSPSMVRARERVICALPDIPGGTSLNENANGQLLAFGYTDAQGQGVIVIIDEETGATRSITSPDVRSSHIQWSHTNPNLLSFAGVPQRLWIVDIRDGKPRNIYKQRPGEWATHEHWWVKDQIVFCGGVVPEPVEERHVKVVDIYSGEVRIIGAGAWWPGGDDASVARENFWHCAGSDDGRWVVADNWHGDITLFEGATSRPRILTKGHRTYGGGAHPHVGWDRVGQRVVFASHLLGNSNVCVATIPAEWQAENPS